MMIRILLLLLVLGGLAARASDPILPPGQGASAIVSQPHVTAELVPETTTVQAGQPFDVALHLHADPGWHTYWINPGDAGLATTITWTLPPGFTAGPIQWPTPEKHDMGGLMTYGYAGDVYLLTTITPPKTDLPRHFEIKASAEWLVCKEECIPGKAQLTLSLDSGLMNLRLPVENKDFFAQARERIPAAGLPWRVDASYAKSPPFQSRQPGQEGIFIKFEDMIDASKRIGPDSPPPGHLRFFPEQPNVLSTQDADNPQPTTYDRGFILSIALQQNGDKPNSLSGVLVSDEPLVRVTHFLGYDPHLGGDDEKAVYVSEFPVLPAMGTATATGSAAAPLGTAAASGEAGPSQGPAPATTETAPSRGPVPATAETAPARGPATAVTETATSNAAITEAPPLLIAVLGAAFVGGLILNLMPCVLPVLSLKVFSLMKHAGDDPKSAWVQGAAFTAGVVLSFWVLAGLLMVLRTAGNEIGWGFQMQSPGFVLALILLFFLLGLNLFGVFELGSSLVGLDAKATGNLGGLASSFGNGALATLAATPCTAPFMGSALGFAAQQPAYVSLLIFTFLALGMATPYLLLTIFPGALRFVPKPGAWMEAFKQFMGFLLMASVIYLVYVFGALVGQDSLPMLLFVLLLAGVAAWIYGRWGTALHSGMVRGVAVVLAAGLLASSIGWGVMLTDAAPPLGTTAATTEAAGREGGAGAGHRPPLQGEWQPWSPAAVDEALTQGRPVFVDFTAAWCLSCKVNEALALGTDAVKQAFAQKDVALFRADWTHADPEISETLRKFNRDGVPLYLVYSPKDKGAPQVLPEVLTPGIVLDALKSL